MSQFLCLFYIAVIVIAVDEIICATKKAAKGSKKSKNAAKEQELEPEIYFRSIKKDMLGIHVIGLVGLDEKTKKIVPGGVEKETIMIFEHMKNILQKYNTTFKRVATFKFYVKDKSCHNMTEGILKKYVEPPLPGRSLIETNNLEKDVNIECEFVAFTEKLDRSMIQPT